MAFRPETASPLNELVEILLTGPSTLSKGERELIATYVSSRNCTHFATASTAPSRPRIWAATKRW